MDRHTGPRGYSTASNAIRTTSCKAWISRQNILVGNTIPIQGSSKAASSIQSSQGRWYGHAGINTLRPRQNGRHFADDIFKCIFLNKNVWISIKVSLKFAPKRPIDNIPAMVQIMASRRPGDKPLWLFYRRIYASLGINEALGFIFLPFHMQALFKWNMHWYIIRDILLGDSYFW